MSWTGRDATGGGAGGGSAGASDAGVVVSDSAGAGAGAGAVVFGFRFRTLSARLWTLSHPEVLTTTSAHIANSVRCRIASLHREEDTGAVCSTQEGTSAPLGMRHDPHDIAAGVAHSRDGRGRAVGVVPDITQNHVAVILEIGQRARVCRVASFAMGDRELQRLARAIQISKWRVGTLHPHPHRAGQEL